MCNLGKSYKGDTSIILYVTAKIPKEYKIEVDQVEHNREKDPAKVTINVLQTILWARFACIKEQNKNSKKTFLVRPFKGSCNKYGRYFHKSIDCQDKQVNNKGIGTGNKAVSKGHQCNNKCHHCGEHTHKKE